MGTKCALLVVDLFSFNYERAFMLFLSDNNQADVIEVFNSTSRYLEYFFIDNPYFDQMTSVIFPTELPEALFLDLSIINVIFSSKIFELYDFV